MFFHPFDENNQILLTPDVDGKPLSKFDMSDFNPLSAKRAQVIKTLTKEEREKEESSNSFIDFCSSLTEDYEDSFDTYVNVCKNAEDEVKNRMRILAEKEARLITLRKTEMKKCNTKINKDGYVVIGSRNKKQNPEYVSIHRINYNTKMG